MRTRAVPFLLLALLLPGCARGEEPTPSAETGLQPRLQPEKKKDGRPHRVRGSEKGRPGHGNDGREPRVTPSSKKSESGSDKGGSPTAGAPRPSAPSTEPSGPRTATVMDRTGDARGLGVPAYADLTGAELRRDGGRWSLTASATGAYPSSTDKILHVICFVDTDGDGQIDYELWGTLADNGWNGTWRHPSGARFGSASGVSVRAQGSDLVFGFDASRLGGARSFRWLVGAEHGTAEQQAVGAMSQDYAPDHGAVRFPG